MKEPFLSDAPSSADEFKRRPFAERVARTLASPDAKTGVVAAIHAPAGDGKTTVLRFVQEILGTEPKTLCAEFSPWNIESPLEFPGVLLATLADVLDALSPAETSPVRDAARQYAACFRPAADASSEQNSSLRISTAKAAVDRALAETGNRIIVLIDDVDRLTGPQLLALLKAVRVTADFTSVSYLLAGDDSVMAEIISLTLARSEAGRELLEKAIQIPLAIPKARPDRLREYFLRRLKGAIDPTAISVRPDAEARFSELFVQGLQSRLTTARLANRYVNAVGFALGLLKSRVNTVDLIVVEGIRLLYPTLYRVMRENRDDFLWYRIGRDGPEADQRANELLQMATTGLKGWERDAVQFLIKSLFPAFDRSRSPSRGDIERWTDDKRICTPEFFDRFFDYAEK